MSVLSQTLASRFRTMKSRKISQDVYLRDLKKLADLGSANAPGSVDRVFDEMDRVSRLRRRIAELEKRVREMESHK